MDKYICRNIQAKINGLQKAVNGSIGGNRQQDSAQILGYGGDLIYVAFRK